jgi:hypothetical protein
MSREVSVDGLIKFCEEEIQQQTVAVNIFRQRGTDPVGPLEVIAGLKRVITALRRSVLLERVAEAGRQCIAYCDIPFLDDTDPQPDPEVFVDRDLLMKLKSTLRDHDKLGKEG